MPRRFLVMAVAVAGILTLAADERFLPWMDADGRPLEFGQEPERLPTGCPDFTVERPRPHGGAVVDAADFGVSETLTDNTPALQRAVDHCRRVGAERLVLRKGTYRFFGERSVVFRELRDFTFDGGDALLVFRRPSRWRPEELIWQNTFHPEDANFFIVGCERCAFGDYRMDWDWQTDPLATFARVTALHPNETNDTLSSVDFDLVDCERHPFHPRPMPLQCIAAMTEARDGFASNPVRNQGGGARFLDLCEGSYGRAMEWLAPNRIRLYPVRLPDAPGTHWRPSDSAKFVKEKFDPAKGRKVLKWYVVGQLYRLAHYYPGKSGVYMEGNRHLTIERETIHSCRGMAHVIDGPQHHTAFLHVRVAPPPGVRRPITATADAMHVANSLGWVKIEDFSVTLNQDDFSNIHDCTVCGRRTGRRTVEITHQRGNLYFRGAVGDPVEFRNPDFSPFGFTAKIVRIEGDVLSLDRDVPADLPDGAIFFNRARGTNFVRWKDCVIDRAWGRATMMGSNFTFENCVFRNVTTSPLKVQAAFHPCRWAEGMGATNHVYRGCTFESNQLFSRPPFGTVVSDIFVGSNIRRADYSADTSARPWNGAVGDILFERCRFIRPRGAVAHFYSGHNLVFRDNEIVVGPARDVHDHPYRGSLVVEYPENVRFSGNLARSADASVTPGVVFRQERNQQACKGKERNATQ